MNAPIPSLESNMSTDISTDDVFQLQRANQIYNALCDQVGKVIVGQNEVIELVSVTIFAGGHCLLEGVPGLAKTRLIRSIAEALSISFGRVQFTPDLMPSDITGTEIVQEDPETGRRAFQFLPGPVFANLVLADELNRTPPKTQAALLEAMQEKQVTVGGTVHPLPTPFFVLATQNQIEQEGTYTLPEAQLDRFLLKIKIDFPSWEEERQIALNETSEVTAEVESIASGEEILQIQQLIRRCPMAEHVLEFCVNLIRNTRPGPDAKNFIDENVNWGAGPRGLITLVLCAKARAILHGREHASMEDVKFMAIPVLRHRIGLSFAAESSGLTTDQLIRQLIDETNR